MSLVYHQRQRDDLVPWTDRLELAKVVANTDFVPGSLRGNPAAICAAILYGDEVGLGPMQSLAQIAVIDGKPTLSAEAQRALILAAGHEFTVEDSTVSRVTVAGRRRDSDHTVRVTWTLDDAKRAGIAGRHAWRAYPRQMLLARATAELARAIFADAIGGLAATEEIEEAAEVGPTDPPPTAPSTRATTTRRRRKTTPALATSPPSAEPSTPEAPPLPGEQAEETVAIDTPAAEPPITPPIRTGQGDIPEAFPDPDPEPEPTGDDRPVTDAMKKRLDTLVGILRDRGGHITTEQIYYAIGTLRRQTPEDVEGFVGGRDEAGTLHWGPLRDSLTRGEARQLSDWFTAKESQVADAPPPVPGDEWTP